MNEVEVTLNQSQWDIQIINANTTYALWPRAGGKTTGGIGPRILRLSEVMPRCQILIVSDTYERLENRVIPNIAGFLTDKLKLVEGVDFVKYKKPPDHWQKPFIPLDKFERVISFASGLALCLVSLAVEGSANAFNAQAAIIDEAKFCKEEKINTEVLPALRGEAQRFGHLPEYLSKWFFTDKYGANIKWLLRKKKLVNNDAVIIVKKLQEHIIRLQEVIAEPGTDAKTIADYKKKIFDYTKRINEMRRHMIYVSDMRPFENLTVLGEFYFKSQKRICTWYEYQVAILNMDPDKVENTYYPALSDKNKYAGITDYNPTRPFYGAFDYNFRIAPLPIAQFGVLPGRAYRTFNIIDYVYELYPLGLDDAVKSFCNRYKNHLNKEFNYVYDKTAKNRSPHKKTFKDIVIETFEANGWNVIEHYIGEPPEHDIKFENLKKWLSAQGEDSVMMNEITAEQLIKAIEQTSAIIVSGKTKKDKRTEKDEKFPAEDAPHGPDAFDMLLIALNDFGMKEQDSNYVMDMGVR